MEILQVDGVSLTYQTTDGETEAVKNVSFGVETGEFISIVGPSGCGKTTILSLIAGLIPPTDGRITILGKDVASSRRNIGYMLQRDQLFEWRSILANVTLGLEVQHSLTPENRAYARELLEKYGLKDFEKHFPSQLSGGMRQRVALIRTLALRPEILLLDEPFSALDFQTRLSVCCDVKRIIDAEHKTAILVTHDISEAVSLSDKIIVLSARPATVKRIFPLDFESASPLERREHRNFSQWFDAVWREVEQTG